MFWCWWTGSRVEAAGVGRLVSVWGSEGKSPPPPLPPCGVFSVLQLAPVSWMFEWVHTEPLCCPTACVGRKERRPKLGQRRVCVCVCVCVYSAGCKNSIKGDSCLCVCVCVFVTVPLLWIPLCLRVCVYFSWHWSSDECKLLSGQMPTHCQHQWTLWGQRTNSSESHDGGGGVWPQPDEINLLRLSDDQSKCSSATKIWRHWAVNR